MRGKSSRKQPRVTEKRKSRRAALILANFLPKPWNQKKCPACFSLERWSTSPASSAASTSSGPGRPDFAPGRRCEGLAIDNLHFAISNNGQFKFNCQLQITNHK